MSRAGASTRRLVTGASSLSNQSRCRYSEWDGSSFTESVAPGGKYRCSRRLFSLLPSLLASMHSVKVKSERLGPQRLTHLSMCQRNHPPATFTNPPSIFTRYRDFPASSTHPNRRRTPSQRPRSLVQRPLRHCAAGNLAMAALVVTMPNGRLGYAGGRVQLYSVDAAHAVGLRHQRLCRQRVGAAAEVPRLRKRIAGSPNSR